ncbi:MAG: nicotinamidase [Armatimonadota bacterium]
MADLSVGGSDALIVVDLQNDFCPGGALPVPKGDEIVQPINSILQLFPLVVATQDWHPENHVSFQSQGGPWPPHCVAGTWGAEPHPAFLKSEVDVWIRKATAPDKDAYSGFEGTDLADQLRVRGITRVFITGLATDYCVRATALDALAAGFNVVVLSDCIRGVDVNPGDSERAVQEMAAAGAVIAVSTDLK